MSVCPHTSTALFPRDGTTGNSGTLELSLSDVRTPGQKALMLGGLQWGLLSKGQCFSFPDGTVVSLSSCELGICPFCADSKTSLPAHPSVAHSLSCSWSLKLNSHDSMSLDPCSANCLLVSSGFIGLEKRKSHKEMCPEGQKRLSLQNDIPSHQRASECHSGESHLRLHCFQSSKMCLHYLAFSLLLSPFQVFLKTCIVCHACSEFSQH